MSAYNGAYSVRAGYHGPRKPSRSQSVIALVRACECGAFLVSRREGDDPRLIWPETCPSCGAQMKGSEP